MAEYLYRCHESKIAFDESHIRCLQSHIRCVQSKKEGMQSGNRLSKNDMLKVYSTLFIYI